MLIVMALSISKTILGDRQILGSLVLLGISPTEQFQVICLEQGHLANMLRSAGQAFMQHGPANRVPGHLLSNLHTVLTHPPNRMCLLDCRLDA